MLLPKESDSSVATLDPFLLTLTIYVLVEMRSSAVTTVVTVKVCPVKGMVAVAPLAIGCPLITMVAFASAAIGVTCK